MVKLGEGGEEGGRETKSTKGTIPNQKQEKWSRHLFRRLVSNS